ncbi:uncharacterized protein [Henckelia pumila]|uniref:uncharacterized protein isoform X2 n=1 Tax=Henckelia pumila TaxID=405737 RepID=UPI003C6DC9D8
MKQAPSMAYSTLAFVETDLGEVERVHLNCFPGYGRIRIDAMMVKRRSCYYYLPESLPLKYAFRDSNGNWFLRVLVHVPSNDNLVDSFKCNGIQVIGHNSTDDGVTELGCSLSSGDKNIMKCGRKESKVLITSYRKTSSVKVPTIFHLLMKRKKRRKRDRRGTTKAQRIAKGIVTRAEAHRRKRWDSGLSEAMSETVSVSGIIHKYFSDYDEVASSSRLLGRHKERLNSSKNSKYCNFPPDLMSPVIAHKPPQVEKPDSKASGEKCRKPEVGKRVVLASNSLGLTPSNERPALSVCKVSDKRSDGRFASMVRTLVFEIPDEGD